MSLNRLSQFRGQVQFQLRINANKGGRMKKYIEREIKRLTRERKNIDTVIADFERLEAQAAPNGEMFTTIAARRSGNLKVMDKKRLLPQHNRPNVPDDTGAPADGAGINPTEFSQQLCTLQASLQRVGRALHPGLPECAVNQDLSAS
jgi:hypothetical protein